MQNRLKTMGTFALLLGLPLAACDSSTAPNQGRANIFMQQSGTVLAANRVMSASGLAQVDLGAVESLSVDVTGVQLLPAGMEGDQDGQWVTVSLTGDESGVATVNLLGLPEDLTDQGLLLASGDVAAGDYSAVRLLVSGGTIVFSQPVSVGNANFDAGTEYSVDIPSGAQSGLKVQGLTLTIDEGATEDATLVFDPTESVAHIVATGNGTVKLTPVLHAKASGAAVVGS